MVKGGTACILSSSLSRRIDSSCNRLLPGFKLGLGVSRLNDGICTAMDGNCHTNKCGVRVFDSILRARLGTGHGRTVQKSCRVARARRSCRHVSGAVTCGPRAS